MQTRNTKIFGDKRKSPVIFGFHKKFTLSFSKFHFKAFASTYRSECVGEIVHKPKPEANDRRFFSNLQTEFLRNYELTLVRAPYRSHMTG